MASTGVEPRDKAAIVFETRLGELGVVATTAGIRHVLLPDRASRRHDVDGSGSAVANAKAAADQLAEYVRGEREEFSLSVDWTDVEPSHRHVLETLCEIAPFGRTVTYGALAQRSDVTDPREIGLLMSRNPVPLVVPCHRVVAADGLGGYGGGLELKRRLLELEGVLPPRLDLGDV